MLKIFQEFREKLDDIMQQAFGHRVVLYGYDYTGRFLEWYAEYYHSIKMDFIIIQDWSGGVPYNFPLFRDTLFSFNYMDVKEAIVWLAIPENEEITKRLEENGYIKNKTYFNFLEIVYGEGNYRKKDFEEKDVFQRRKIGWHSVQFMEWLEYLYNCNLVTAIDSTNFVDAIDGGHSYRITTQKEIFPILDKCHCIPQKDDAIFDFGCGKGGAMLTFLDYGFQKVGGVEYEKKIYEIMVSNFSKLGISYTEDEKKKGKEVLCLQGNAAEVTIPLDEYNWFYYFDPFEKEIFSETIKNICESLKRKPRKIHIININPKYYNVILESGYFVLTNQFCVSMRQKVVDIFVTKKEFEKRIE